MCFVYNSHISFNPLAIILNQNKLPRLNYVDWKRNLDIVLITEGYKYVLTKEHLDLRATNTPRLESEKYEKCAKADEMTRCYILVSMSSVLQH